MKPADAERALSLAEGVCVRFEGFRAKPYLCPAGVPTIGYGSTRYPDGRAVTLTDPPITRAAARALLRYWLAEECLPQVRRLCPGATTAGQISALLDFTYNLGAGALARSTLRKRVNAGAWGDVPAQLRRWVYGGGVVLNGLVDRREAEIALLEIV